MVLGGIAEENFLRSLEIADGSFRIFVNSWPSRVLVVATLLVLAGPFVKAAIDRSQKTT